MCFGWVCSTAAGHSTLCPTESPFFPFRKHLLALFSCEFVGKNVMLSVRILITNREVLDIFFLCAVISETHRKLCRFGFRSGFIHAHLCNDDVITDLKQTLCGCRWASMNVQKLYLHASGAE